MDVTRTEDELGSSERCDDVIETTSEGAISG